MACLHGNVRIGYCLEHNGYGRNGYNCPVCNHSLKPTPLLFPIKNKDDNNDPFIIDTKLESDILDTWSRFLFSQHYKICKDFYESLLRRYARRSVEGLFVPTIEGKLVEDIPVPKNGSWRQLRDWFDDMVASEQK